MMKKSPETRPDETQRFGMEVTRIGNDAMQVSSPEQIEKTWAEIEGFTKSGDVPTLFKKQLLRTALNHAKDTAIRQRAVDRLAEIIETEHQRDIEDGIKEAEVYANDGFVNEIVRDAQRASDEYRKDKEQADEEEGQVEGEEGWKSEIIDLKVKLKGSEVVGEAEEIVKVDAQAPKVVRRFISEREKFMHPAAAEKLIKGIEKYLKNKNKIRAELERPETRVALEKSRIGNALATLDDESRSVVEALFGLNKRHAKEAEEVADEMGLSVERVLEIRERALEQLSKEMPQP